MDNPMNELTAAPPVKKWWALVLSGLFHPLLIPTYMYLLLMVVNPFLFGANGFWDRRALLTLLMIETTDILFAFDSIPAILAITTDPFLVFSSNVFAILGLRSLYFVLASMMDRFEYMKYSLAIILFFVAAKMMLHEFWHPAEWLSLVVIFVLLAGGVFVSLYQTTKEERVG